MDLANSLKARLNSFKFAFAGIAYMLKTQRNAQIHCVAALMVSLAGWQLNISANDWRWLISAMCGVLMAEALNTALEYVCDVVSPNYHSAVKHAKDIAAGAVLICALGAAGIGLSVLGPYLG